MLSSTYVSFFDQYKIYGKPIARPVIFLLETGQIRYVHESIHIYIAALYSRMA